LNGHTMQIVTHVKWTFIIVSLISTILFAVLI